MLDLVSKMEKAIKRQNVLLNHLSSSSSSPSLSICLSGASSSSAYERRIAYDDDVVIVAAFRTAICRAKRGGFKNTYPDELLASVLKGVIEKTNLNPSEVGDIIVGTLIAEGSQRATECRMAAFCAGFPETVPVKTLNRQGASGLQAVVDVAAAIKAGFYDIEFKQAKDCLIPMGITAENIAARFGITREEQDMAAAESHRRAAAANASGKFRDEIVPVKIKIVDSESGEEKLVTVISDDGIRPNITVSDLAKLKPAFMKDGTVTAGNSSQVSDGAAAVLVMKRSVAMRKRLPILGVFRSFVAVGVDPAIMGIGPSVAIPAALKAANLQLDDINLFEITEAFAAQFVYCQKKLGLDRDKVNVNGGAMALGHPLGATGARSIATLLHEMKRRGRDCRFGVVSMCLGSGMGAAAVFERREDE
ncbi:hypothetical protein V2J09_005848 [Rumex salicifolius]